VIPAARLERLAVEVPDLDGWVRRFEALLGPGFTRHRVQQAAGPVELAIHPNGIELVYNPAATAPRLRSFHLATADVDDALRCADRLGWRRIDTVTLDGRRHEIVDAEGLRILLLAEPPGPE
jgi:hypothetical protein